MIKIIKILTIQFNKLNKLGFILKIIFNKIIENHLMNLVKKKYNNKNKMFTIILKKMKSILH